MRSRSSFGGHAAPFGFADYLAIPGGTAAKRTATLHLIVNVTALALYVGNWFLRRSGAAAGDGTWPLVFLLEVFTFVCLAISGWLGGRLVFEEKVGIADSAPGTGGPVDRHA